MLRFVIYPVYYWEATVWNNNPYCLRVRPSTELPRTPRNTYGCGSSKHHLRERNARTRTSIVHVLVWWPTSTKWWEIVEGRLILYNRVAKCYSWENLAHRLIECFWNWTYFHWILRMQSTCAMVFLIWL